MSARRLPLTVAAMMAILLGGCAVNAGARMQGVQVAALQQFAEEMEAKHGFESETVLTVLTEAEYRQEIIDAITSPAEALPWYRYRPIFLTDSRIEEGAAFWDEHAETLRAARERFGVDEAAMVAIVGVESRYGRHRGQHRVIDALRTLAFDYPPRAGFFRRQLEAYFLLAREENIDPTQPRGSYAGAMGVPQFISSSYRAYAVDFNDNGQRDLWDEIPDILGSVGNYFHRHGWQPGAPVVDRVEVTGSDWTRFINDDLEPRATVAELRGAGVEIPEDVDAQRPAKLLELAGADGPEYFAAYRNFYVITRYNHSPLYAMAVHQLSRAIAERRGRR